VIHFNNGLHAGHLTDEEYKLHLARYVRLIRELGRNSRLIWASSTPVTQAVEGHPLDEVKNGQVLRRNAVAAGIMAENRIPVNDLYTLVAGKGELRFMDGYHYNENGYQVLGAAVAEKILNHVKGLV
jgi:lysophospholipase L1-like esterase